MSNNTTANVILGLDVNEFRRGITQVDSSIKKMSGQFSALGGVIGAAFVGSKIQEFAQQSIDLALQAEGVARAFERIGNEANLRLMRAGQLHPHVAAAHNHRLVQAALSRFPLR